MTDHGSPSLPAWLQIAASISIALLVSPSASTADDSAVRRFLLQGEGKLAIVADDTIEWEMPWGGIHDVHVTTDAAGKPRTVFVQQGAAKVAEIDLATKQVVWSYDSAQSNGNAGRKVEVHAFQPLEGGRLMIAESGPARIIEIDRDGNLLHELKLKVDHPHPHTDTRLARKLASGNYLVCHEGDGAVREYSPEGKVVWEYAVPLFGREPRKGHGPEAFGNKCFAALRLPSGNTLITTGNGHGAIEVTPAGEIVWHLDQRDLPGIVLAWVTTIEVLPGGNYVIGNCHAGPGQPVLVEIEPKSKRVVWRYDGFDAFGNSVSNSVRLDGGR